MGDVAVVARLEDLEDLGDHERRQVDHLIGEDLDRLIGVRRRQTQAPVGSISVMVEASEVPLSRMMTSFE